MDETVFSAEAKATICPILCKTAPKKVNEAKNELQRIVTDLLAGCTKDSQPNPTNCGKGDFDEGLQCYFLAVGSARLAATCECGEGAKADC